MNDTQERLPKDYELVEFTAQLDGEELTCQGYYDARVRLFYSGHDAFTLDEVMRWRSLARGCVATSL
jgi:hypothetical protein